MSRAPFLSGDVAALGIKAYAAIIVAFGSVVFAGMRPARVAEAAPRPPEVREETSALRDTMHRVTDTADAEIVPVARPIGRREAPKPFAVAALAAKSDSEARGSVRLFSETDASEDGTSILVSVQLQGMEPGLHGFHIHENGDCSGINAAAAGKHWNPTGERHGAPTNPTRHLGDLGNIRVDADGEANAVIRINFTTDQRGDARTAILGRAVVVRERADDFVTNPDGGAGLPIACGVLESSQLTAH